MGDGPIFVGGIDRTGKTLLCQMLSRHPRLSFTRRTYFWTRYYRRFGDLNHPENFERCLSTLLKQKAIQDLAPDPQRIRLEFNQGPRTYAHLFGTFHRQYAERAGKPRWGDQLGMVERFAKDIFEAFPDARMIHMIRHPSDRFEAALEGQKSRKGKIGWSLAKWRDSIAWAQENRRKFPGRYRTIRFEDLVREPEKTLREICEFIGEEFAPSMLEVVSTSAPERQAPHLSNSETAFVEKVAGKDLDAFGYETSNPKLSSFERLAYLFVDYPINLLTMIVGKKVQARI